MYEIPEVVRNCNLPNLAKLYSALMSLGDYEYGSSSIDQKFNGPCREVKKLIKERFGVSQKNEGLDRLWQHLNVGDTSFYFGGYRILADGQKSWVKASEYIELLCMVSDKLSDDTVRQFDELCGEFLRPLSQIVKLTAGTIQ